MNSEDLDKEIQAKLNLVVNRSVMISIIKQRFLVSKLPVSEINSNDFSNLNGFGGNIDKYKFDKFGLYGGVINDK